jgi:hypothetical protein
VVYHEGRAGLEDGDLLGESVGGGLESDSFALSGAGLVELRADVDSRSLWWTIVMSGLRSYFVKYDPADNPGWILKLTMSLNTLALVSKDRNIKAIKWRRHRKI